MAVNELYNAFNDAIDAKEAFNNEIDAKEACNNEIDAKEAFLTQKIPNVSLNYNAFENSLEVNNTYEEKDNIKYNYNTEVVDEEYEDKNDEEYEYEGDDDDDDDEYNEKKEKKQKYNFKEKEYDFLDVPIQKILEIKEQLDNFKKSDIISTADIKFLLCKFENDIYIVNILQKINNIKINDIYIKKDIWWNCAEFIYSRTSVVCLENILGGERMLKDKKGVVEIIQGCFKRVANGITKNSEIMIGLITVFINILESILSKHLKKTYETINKDEIIKKDETTVTTHIGKKRYRCETLEDEIKNHAQKKMNNDSTSSIIISCIQSAGFIGIFQEKTIIQLPESNIYSVNIGPYPQSTQEYHGSKLIIEGGKKIKLPSGGLYSIVISQYDENNNSVLNAIEIL